MLGSAVYRVRIRNCKGIGREQVIALYLFYNISGKVHTQIRKCFFIDLIEVCTHIRVGAAQPFLMIFKNGNVCVSTINVVFIEIIYESIVDVAPYLVFSGCDDLYRKQAAAVVSYPVFKHTADKRSVLGICCFIEAGAFEHFLCFGNGAFHHCSEFLRNKDRFKKSLSDPLQKYRVIAHQADVPKKMPLCLVRSIVSDIGHIKAYIWFRQFPDRFKEQMQVYHRHICDERIRLFCQEFFKHTQGILVHKCALSKQGTEKLIVVVYLMPVTGKDITGVHNTEIDRAPVFLHYWFKDK